MLNTSPIIFGFVVLFSVGILLGIYSIYKYGYEEFLSLLADNWHFLVFMGIISSVTNFFIFWGLRLSSAVNSAIITRLDVLFAALLGSIFFGEKLKELDWIAVAILLFGSLRIVHIDFSELFISKGDFLFVLHALFLAINAQIIRYKLCHVFGPIKACINAGTCGIVYFITILITGQTQQMFNLEEIKIPIFVSIILALFQYLTYYYGLQMLETWTVRSLFLVMLLTSSISSYLILREEILTVQIQGMLLVSVGVLLLSYNQKLKGEKDARKL